MSPRIGVSYRYRVGSYILPLWFRVESFNGVHWVARSQDSFEAEVYVDTDGRHIGSRDLGMYDGLIDVFLVLEDDNNARSWKDV